MNLFKDDNTHLFPGFYRGQVVENRDPLNSQRVRVRILGLHSPEKSDDEVKEGIPDDQCPWAEQAGIFLDGTYIPEKGNWVWLFFENGNHNHPVYFAKCRRAYDTPPELDNFKTSEIGGSRSNETSEINHGHLQIKVAETLHGPKVELRNKSNNAFIKLDTFDNKSRITLSADIVTIDGQVEMGKGPKGYPLLVENPRDLITLQGIMFRSGYTGIS
jgi:hypothetical protein